MHAMSSAVSRKASFPFSSMFKSQVVSQFPVCCIKIRHTCCLDGVTNVQLSSSLETTSPVTRFPNPVDRQARRGCEVLTEALRCEGVTHIFSYPGSSSMAIVEAVRLRTKIRNVVARHEQGSIFAAEGYARASGIPGVCIVTSGPGATNLVTGLANAYMDSVPVVVITGQIPSYLIGTGDVQDTPVVHITKPITKKNYIVSSVEDIPRIVQEAFFLAQSGRPGPVLIDIPKDIQELKAIPDWNQPIQLDEYLAKLPKHPPQDALRMIVDLILESKRPLLYAGGGCLNSANELRQFAELTGIPVANTLMSLGTYPCSDDELSLQMLGLYGTDHANYAASKCDLLLAFGARFHRYATLEGNGFQRKPKIVHVDIDPDEIGRHIKVDLSVCTNIKLALEGMNSILKGRKRPDFSIWRNEIKQRKCVSNYRIMCNNPDEDEFKDVIHPWHVLQLLDELTNGNAIICTGAGEHLFWAAQFYTHKHPRHFLAPCGFGPMGFGLPAAIGAAMARPDAVVVDIDGDGSFLMNIQELDTVRVENLPVKMVILNNGHLGMMATWEDHFCDSVRAHSYLGDRSKPLDIFPDMLKFAEACHVPAARVERKRWLRGVMKKMLETTGPYLLDVVVPLEDHALPTNPMKS